MNELFVIIFWMSVFSLFYIYGGFSILLSIVGKILKREVKKELITPKVSLIIAAYNEEHSIAEKLDNILSLDYPEDALEVIVASDGSDDNTNSIVSRYLLKGIELLALPRQGKIFALNEAVKLSSGQILIFSDANTLFLPQALRMLVRNFADPEVGGVCGNQKHLSPKNSDNISKGEHLYWSYDKWLKTMESLTGSIVSADGAIYAIRRELYQMPSSSDVTDDFAISTSVIEQGYRLVFESKALAHEKASSMAKSEFNRKVRIINRGLRGIILRKRLLNPFKYGFYSVILFSHKVLRRLVPLILMLLFIVSIGLAFENSFYLLAALIQSLFYLLAYTGYLLRNWKLGHSRVFYIPFFYCLANAAAFVAITKLIRGKRIESWQPQRERLEQRELAEGNIS